MRDLPEKAAIGEPTGTLPAIGSPRRAEVSHAAFCWTSTHLSVSFVNAQDDRSTAELPGECLRSRLPGARGARGAGGEMGALAHPYARRWPGAHRAATAADRRQLRQDD